MCNSLALNRDGTFFADKVLFILFLYERIVSDHNQYSNRLAMPAWRFRHEVYALGVKRVISLVKGAI